MQVRARYDSIQIVGKQVIQKADELLEEKANLDNLIGEVKNYWSGSDAEQFIAKSLAYSASLVEIANVMKEQGNVICNKGATYQAITEDFKSRISSI